MTVEPLAALLKLLLYAGALIGGGVALAATTLRSRLGDAGTAAPRWIAGGAAAAMIGALAGKGLLLWQLGGFDGPTVAAVLAAPTGIALGLQLAGGALLLAGCRASFQLPLRLAGAAALFASFGVNGHAAASSPLAGGVAALHLLAAAWWLGSLLLLRNACVSLPSGSLAGLARYFGRQAFAGVGAMAASGVVLVLVLVPLELAAWLTAYALNLAFKIGFAAGALAVATYARTRLVPRIAGGAAAAPRSLKRTVTLEIALIGGALAATAWLTTFHSPHEYHDGLAAAAAQEESGRESRRQALAALLEEHWEYTLSTHPEEASVLGDRRFGDQWSDPSAAAAARNLAKSRELLARVEAIDTAGFPRQESLDKTLLVRQLNEVLDNAIFEEWLMPVDQKRGIHLRAAQLASELPFETVQDYEDYATRLSRLPAQMEAAIAAMREGRAKNLMPPRFLLEKVARQAAGIAGLRGEKSPFAKPLAKMPGEWPAAEQERLRRRVSSAIREQVLPAYARFAAFVEKEYAPAGRTEAGLWSLPAGEARYAARVEAETTTGLTPDQIHQLGLSEVKRIEGELLAVARQLGFADLRSFGSSLERNRTLAAKSGQQLVALYKDHIYEMQLRLPLLFGRLPRAALEVVPMEGYRAAEAAGADYVRGSPDGVRPGRIYVDTYQPTRRKTLDVETLAYHEGVPGHHLQMSIQQELTALPPFRRQAWNTAYGEGWALYAESLAYEVGLLRDPYSRYGKLQDEMQRAISLVVDTGLHAKRWTREQAVQFFHQHSTVDDIEVQSETDRYIAWPAQALASKIGQLKILELRRRAEKTLGPRFDVRSFHDEILGAGPLPLDLLEQRIDAFIAAPAANPDSSEPFGAHSHFHP